MTPKASRIMGRKSNPPGQHGARQRFGRSRLSDYGRQLLEKQKLAAQYNVTEKQMRNYYEKAYNRARKESDITTADLLVQYLETRLDAVVLRAGLARSIYAARQYVTHGHLTVNDRRVNVPAYTVQVGDVVAVKEGSQKVPCFSDALESANPPQYLELIRDDMSVKLLHLPKRDDVPVICEVRLVLEFYSRH